MKKKTFILALLLTAITTLLFCSCKTTEPVKKHPSVSVVASTDYITRMLVVKNQNGTIVFSDTIDGEPVYANKINSDKPYDVDTYIIYWCRGSKTLCSYAYDYDEFICLEPMHYDGKYPKTLSRQ